MNILYVDDSEEMRQMFSVILIGFDCQTCTAVDGKDAMQKIVKERYDLVLSDTNMPEMCGIEFLQQLRKINHKIPFILLFSGSKTYPGIKFEELTVMGADLVVSKPDFLLSARDIISNFTRGFR
jgi:two-component system chemotaxis response regulator CheB